MTDNLENLYTNKEAIRHLFEDKRFTILEIAQMFTVPKEQMSAFIKDQGFKRKRNHIKPSTRKMINKHKAQITKMLRENESILTIAKTINRTPRVTRHIIDMDDDLTIELKRRNQRQIDNPYKENYVCEAIHPDDIPHNNTEEWRPILGYDPYEISNQGRIRHGNKLLIIRVAAGGYLRVKIKNNNGKAKNISVARLVAQTFIPHESIQNTVNHKDGNNHNNWASNLEWTTQSENNQHSYTTLNRRKSMLGPKRYKKIVYQDKYEFKTLTAFAKFIGKSESQARRWLKKPDVKVYYRKS